MRVACRCHLETHEQLETPRPISLGLHAGCCRCDGEEPGHKRCMRDWQPRRRRHVFEGRRVSFRLTTMPTTLEGQPSLLLEKTADVAPVVKTQQRRHCQTHVGVDVADCCVVEQLPSRKMGVVVMLRAFISRRDDESYRLCQSSRGKASSFGLIWTL